MPTIRPARPEDAAALAAAEAETARTPGLLVSRPHELRAEAFERMIRDLAASGRGRYAVAEEDGRPVGHAFVEPMGLEAVAHVVRLTICVHPGCRGRGIGRALMEDLMAWARRAPGVEKVELLVRATNAPAIALYRKLGFEEEGRLRRRVRLPDGTCIDDVAMGWFPHARDRAAAAAPAALSRNGAP